MYQVKAKASITKFSIEKHSQFWHLVYREQRRMGLFTVFSLKIATNIEYLTAISLLPNNIKMEEWVARFLTDKDIVEYCFSNYWKIQTCWGAV